MATPVSARTRAPRKPSAKGRNTLTDAEKAKIAQLHAAGTGRNEIARQLNRSPSLISKVVKDIGGEFDASASVEATALRQAKMKERRLDLAEKLLEDAENLRLRLQGPHTYYERAGENLIPVTLPHVPLRDVAAGYSALSIALKGHNDLMSGSAETSMEAKRSVLANLIDGIKGQVAADKAAGIAAPDMSAPSAEELADPNAEKADREGTSS